jgi:hypothetical protein
MLLGRVAKHGERGIQLRQGHPLLTRVVAQLQRGVQLGDLLLQLVQRRLLVVDLPQIAPPRVGLRQ